MEFALAEAMLQRLSISEIESEECGWHVFTEEIFPRLPASQLQTIKSVCKNWYHIISNPYFVRLHLNLYNQIRIRVLVLQNSGLIEYTNCESCDEEIKSIPYPPAFCRRKSKILGSCDGLLCLFLRGGRGAHRTIAVYNPSTGEFFRVRHHDFHLIDFSWFGLHPSSGQYVLVLWIPLPNYRFQLGLYYFTRSNLQLIHSTSRGIDMQFFTFRAGEERGTLLHGALHWPARLVPRHDFNQHRYIISAYHLDDNKYFEIAPPVRSDVKLGVARGCLFAIFQYDTYMFEMWIMKEYGVQESWTKYADIEGFNKSRVVSPLGFFPNGDLILDVDKFRLCRYSFNHRRATHLKDYDTYTYPYDGYDRSDAILCADSLVSPSIFEGGV